MLTVLCAGCFGVVENYDDLEFDEFANAFHLACRGEAAFDTDEWEE